MKLKPLRVFTRYDEIASSAETSHFCLELASVLCRRLSVASPLREKTELAIIQKDLLTLASMELRYDTLTVSDAFVHQQIRALFSHREDLSFKEHDKGGNALAKFVKAEQLCRETNEIFRLRSGNRFCFRPCVESVLFRAQRKITKILGDLPSFTDLSYRFGPGSTTTIKKADACPRNKLGLKSAVSMELRPFVPTLWAEMPGWSQRDEHGNLPERAHAHLPPVVEAVGKIEFVPKNYKNHRAIAKEPDLNVMVQAALGDHMVKRLAKFGCDLKSGKDRNMSLARQGSLSNALATLDLSSASDTVATALVYDLLPIDWAEFLDNARTSRVDLFGDLIDQEKFSSMGNGFTFPLETLIFYALASSCSDVASVFGDDIIIETKDVALLVEVLTACGFIINTDKSFTDGPFRESCGGDYFLGIDIRPCFIRNRLSAASLFTLHNFFARRFDEEVTDLCKRKLAPAITIFGPDGYGDGHLIGDWTPKHPHRRRGYCGVSFDTFQLKGKTSIEVSHGDFVLPCYSIYISEKRNPLADEGSSSQKKFFVNDVLTSRGISSTRTRLELTSQSVHSFIEAPLPTAQYDKRGRLTVTLPGTAGYRRIQIYTLERP